MGEHRLPRPRLTPEHEKHIRASRVLSARTAYGPDAPIDGATKMWAARYAEDVELLLRELDVWRERASELMGQALTEPR